MNGKDMDFYRLLPKLYKKECHPCEYNYFAMENEHIKAAVGVFPGRVTVCGTNLNYQGIGNVAVNPYSRSKGYMKKLLNQAVDSILQEDIDFSVLSGDRKRYSYFSYEIVGRKYCFRINESNIKHSFDKARKVRFQFALIDADNKEELHKISDLQKKQPIYYNREDDKLYDILKSWAPVDLYGIYEEMIFVGYLLCYDNNTIKEIILDKEDTISEVIADLYKTIAKGDLVLELPEYQRCFIDSLSALAENVLIKDGANYSVFHYERVIAAFLNLKTQTDTLADGEITFLIHGIKREEKLLISVKDNKVSVTQTIQKADYEYTQLEAMSVLFRNYSPLQRKLPMEIQTWLPLPLHIFPADNV